MRPCPKCKTVTLAPLDPARPADPEVVPPSRCVHCKGVWLPHEAVEHHQVSAAVDVAVADPATDALPGFCPRCRSLLTRARVERETHPFWLDKCGSCGGFWFDAGEFAAIASSEWLDHLDDLWDPVWRKRVREKRAEQRHLEELERALGKETVQHLLAAVRALKHHENRALGLSFLIEELRKP
ncbi:MAG TPA: zf-TFIIB domain-containing protein [Myxococcales bacterium]|nr:zf-TFIIB domain-containing protein [Myxococcales bacterium]